jgi:hypothetical protein
MSRDALALSFSMGTVGFALALLWRWWRGPVTRLGLDATPDRPKSFGYKCTWLTVKASSAEEVADELGYDAPARCNWASGFERAFGAIGSKEVFVTPPVDGWVFVLGFPLSDDEDAFDAVGTLSSVLGRPVYAFGSHRGVSAALWGFAEGGVVKRAWSVSDGQVLISEGPVTPEERALDIDFSREPQPNDEAWSRQSHEATVVALAKAWTRDPTTLDEVSEPGVGVLLHR